MAKNSKYIEIDHSDILIALFWALDFSVLFDGKRNRLQEELLIVFADVSGIK